MEKRHIWSSSLVLAAVVMLWSCATEKSREELSLLGKAYHNVTSQYNGWFNANEIMEATYDKLESQNKDNYSQTIGVFPFIEADADGVKSELDRAIEKVSVVASVHKASTWRDDCYLLLGQAQFLKKDYETSESTFEYFADEFDPLKARKGKKVKKKSSKKKKRKVSKRKPKKKKKRSRKRMTREEKAKAQAKAKEEEEKAKAKEEKEKQEEIADLMDEEKDEGGFMKRRPVYKDGLLWLAMTYIQRQKYGLAESYLRRLREDPTTQYEVKEMMYPVMAHSI